MDDSPGATVLVTGHGSVATVTGTTFPFTAEAAVCDRRKGQAYVRSCDIWEAHHWLTVSGTHRRIIDSPAGGCTGDKHRYAGFKVQQTPILLSGG